MASHRRHSRQARHSRRCLTKSITSGTQVRLSQPKRLVFNMPGKVKPFKSTPLETLQRWRSATCDWRSLTGRVDPFMSARGTKLTSQPSRLMFAFGGKADNICSFGAFPLLTDSVDKVADERVEALYWSAWHATPISFSQRSGWSGITLTLPPDA